MTTLGTKKTETIVWQIFRERYPKQVLYFVKVNTNGKLETRTKGIVDKCSDLTCTKKYALTEGAKGGGVNVGQSLSPPPPQSFYARYGPETHPLQKSWESTRTSQSGEPIEEVNSFTYLGSTLDKEYSTD